MVDAAAHVPDQPAEGLVSGNRAGRLAEGDQAAASSHQDAERQVAGHLAFGAAAEHNAEIAAHEQGCAAAADHERILKHQVANGAPGAKHAEQANPTTAGSGDAQSADRMSPAIDDALKTVAVQRDHAIAFGAAIADRLEVRDGRGVKVAHELVIARHANIAVQRGCLAFLPAEIADGFQLPDVADLEEAVGVCVQHEFAGVPGGRIVCVRKAVAVEIRIGTAGQAQARGFADLARGPRRVFDRLRQHAVVAGDVVAVVEPSRSRRAAGRTAFRRAGARRSGGWHALLSAFAYFLRRQVAGLAGVIGRDVLKLLVRAAEHRSAHERMGAPAIAVLLERKEQVALMLPADLGIDRRRTVAVLPMTGKALSGQPLAPLHVTLAPRDSGAARHQEKRQNQGGDAGLSCHEKPRCEAANNTTGNTTGNCNGGRQSLKSALLATRKTTCPAYG